MGIFRSGKAKEPQFKILKQGSGSRVLDFSEFMDLEMKVRIKSGQLEWMYKVAIFEQFYITKRESEGWILTSGSYKSKNTDDRFKAVWQVGEDVIVGKYDDEKSTVTERIKKKS